MKKILIVMLSLYNGGAERSLVNMLNELPSDKYEVDLLLFRKEGMFLNQVPDWINIIDTPDDLKKLYAPVKSSGNKIFTKVIGTAVSRMKEDIPTMREGYRWKYFYSKSIKQLPTKYDVAIAYTSSEVMFYVGDKVQADRKIVWIHNDFRSAQHPKKYDEDYFKKFELVTISEECANILRDEFKGLNKKVYNIANITSSIVTRNRAEEFVPTEFSKGTFNICSIGRLMNQKGFDFAIESAEILKSKGKRFNWYVIGDGDLKSYLEGLIKEKNVEDCFHLIGTRSNPYPYIKNCDLFAQTSRFEGKSVVLDEAKIIGAPILVTKYPTVYDQIEDRKEGYIVEIDSKSIAEGIEYLMDNESERVAMSNYLLAHEYGNQEEIEKYINIIEDKEV